MNRHNLPLSRTVQCLLPPVPCSLPLTKGSTMSNHLPEELSYLQEAAHTYGPAWRYWASKDRVQTHGSAWRQLAATHEQICQREDGPAIAQWLATPLDSPCGRDEQRQLRGLLRLLRELGRLDVTPFDAPPLNRITLGEGALPDQSCDTEHAGALALPTRLRYLLRQAKDLGIRPRWTAVARYIDQIDEPRFNALCATADQMHQRGDDKFLREWLSEPTRLATRERALARGLLHILDALEIF